MVYILPFFELLSLLQKRFPRMPARPTRNDDKYRSRTTASSSGKNTVECCRCDEKSLLYLKVVLDHAKILRMAASNSGSEFSSESATAKVVLEDGEETPDVGLSPFPVLAA